MAVILVRHGETALNATRVMQPADTPLSERGRAQAAALGRRLARHRVAALLSSDLPRAWQTAEAIAAQTGLTIEASSLLHERNFGALRGRPYDTLGFDPLVMAEAPPGGESAAEFEQRVQQAFALMLKRHDECGGDLIVVTHGLLIRRLLAGPLQLSGRTLAGLHLGNTALCVFDARAPHTLSLLNCTQHLLAGERDDAASLSGG